MKKTLLLICILLTTATVTAQFGRQRQNRFNRQPQTPPSESQIEAAEKKAEERRQEFVANFMSTLEADDFTKEILKQTMDDYFEKGKEFGKLPFDNSVQRKDAFEKLRTEHFKEIKTMLSETDNKKLDEFLKGNFEEREVLKDKKKKRKKRRKNKDTEEEDN